MRHVIDPGKARKSINFIDNIVYSKVYSPLKGCEMDLKMSIMVQNGNSEMRAAQGVDQMSGTSTLRPAIVWIPGGGWRRWDKNLMTVEMAFLAEKGFLVASIYYRSSAEAHFPAQLIDVKSAVRFLRANAEKYRIDPNRIGVMGRSAGGYLAAFAAMNTKGYDEGDNLEYSSDVQASWDMFGPVDLYMCYQKNKELVKDPNARWKKLSETHEGALLGCAEEDLPEVTVKSSPVNYVNDKMCPILIMHGDSDPMVPYKMSEELYDKIAEAGMEDREELYLLKGAGHGSDEFFQESTKKIALEFFEKYLG